MNNLASGINPNNKGIICKCIKSLLDITDDFDYEKFNEELSKIEKYNRILSPKYIISEYIYEELMQDILFDQAKTRETKLRFLKAYLNTCENSFIMNAYLPHIIDHIIPFLDELEIPEIHKTNMKNITLAKTSTQVGAIKHLPDFLKRQVQAYLWSG